MRTFSIGCESTARRNELNNAERMAKLFKTDHTFLVSDVEMLRRIPFTIWAADDLMRDYANMPTSVLSRKASEELKVVFTGEGVDEFFAGYGRRRTPPLRRLVRKIRQPGMRGVKIGRKWSRRNVENVFGPEMKKLSDEFGPLRTETSRTPCPARGAPPVRPGERHPGRTREQTHLEGGSNADGLRPGGKGAPRLDHRIVEFGLSLPDHSKVDSNEGTVFLKKWSRRAIPIEHLSLKKSGFHMPAEKLLSGPFLSGLREKLMNNEAIRIGFLHDGVKEMFDRQEANQGKTREIRSKASKSLWVCIPLHRAPRPETHPRRKPAGLDLLNESPHFRTRDSHFPDNRPALPIVIPARANFSESSLDAGEPITTISSATVHSCFRGFSFKRLPLM